MAYCQPGFIDYYAVLGVSKDSDRCAIRKRYKELAHQNHPDKFHGRENKEKATLRFQRISEAFQTLGNCEKRREYDVKYEREQRTSRGGRQAIGCAIYRPSNLRGVCMGSFRDPFEIYHEVDSGSLASDCRQHGAPAGPRGVDPCDFVFSRRGGLAEPLLGSAQAAAAEDPHLSQQHCEMKKKFAYRRMQAGVIAADGPLRSCDLKRRARSWEQSEPAEPSEPSEMVVADGALLDAPRTKKRCPKAKPCAVKDYVHCAGAVVGSFVRRIRSSFDNGEEDADADAADATMAVDGGAGGCCSADGCGPGKCSPAGAGDLEDGPLEDGPPAEGAALAQDSTEMSGKPLCKLPTTGRKFGCGFTKGTAPLLSKTASGGSPTFGCGSGDEDCPIAAFFKGINFWPKGGSPCASRGKSDDRGDLARKVKQLVDEGFDRPCVIDALEKADGDVANAKTLLLAYED